VPVDVTTIPNVELVRVGEHEISTGIWNVTRADLADAVAAARAGVVRDPVIKLGHEGPLGDGAPALGRVRNLRVTGDVLVGDFVDVPRAVAGFLPKAWPQRSVEGLVGYEADDGRTYGFVLTAVALLGATMPGCDGLADIADVAAMYGVAAGSGRRVVIASAPNSDTADADRARAVVVARARRVRSARSVTV
jgi:hypothetical protein